MFGHGCLVVLGVVVLGVVVLGVLVLGVVVEPPLAAQAAPAPIAAIAATTATSTRSRSIDTSIRLVAYSQPRVPKSEERKCCESLTRCHLRVAAAPVMTLVMGSTAAHTR